MYRAILRHLRLCHWLSGVESSIRLPSHCWLFKQYKTTREITNKHSTRYFIMPSTIDLLFHQVTQPAGDSPLQGLLNYSVGMYFDFPIIWHACMRYPLTG